MEVIVVILLLFGAFSLGSATHDSADDDPADMEISTAVSERPNATGNALGDAIGTESDNYVQLQDCMANRHYVIYRDLTNLHVGEVEAEATTPGDCNGTCLDE